MQFTNSIIFQERPSQQINSDYDTGENSLALSEKGRIQNERFFVKLPEKEKGHLREII